MTFKVNRKLFRRREIMRLNGYRLLAVSETVDVMAYDSSVPPDVAAGLYAAAEEFTDAIQWLRTL